MCQLLRPRLMVNFPESAATSTRYQNHSSVTHSARSCNISIRPPPFDVLVVSDIEAWRGPSTFIGFSLSLRAPLLFAFFLLCNGYFLGAFGLPLA